MTYIWNLFVAIDQLFNVLLSPLLNLFVQAGGARFGFPDETISSVLGKNARSDKCAVCSFVCRYILHPIDHGHCDRAVERDEGNA